MRNTGSKAVMEHQCEASRSMNKAISSRRNRALINNGARTTRSNRLIVTHRPPPKAQSCQPPSPLPRHLPLRSRRRLRAAPGPGPAPPRRRRHGHHLIIVTVAPTTVAARLRRARRHRRSRPRPQWRARRLPGAAGLYVQRQPDGEDIDIDEADGHGVKVQVLPASHVAQPLQDVAQR